jgi:uncharacterized membrane-anchored protein YhcB (DUF1043 family)
MARFPYGLPLALFLLAASCFLLPHVLLPSVPPRLGAHDLSQPPQTELPDDVLPVRPRVPSFWGDLFSRLIDPFINSAEVNASVAKRRKGEGQAARSSQQRREEIEDLNRKISLLRNMELNESLKQLADTVARLITRIETDATERAHFEIQMMIAEERLNRRVDQLNHTEDMIKRGFEIIGAIIGIFTLVIGYLTMRHHQASAEHQKASAEHHKTIADGLNNFIIGQKVLVQDNTPDVVKEPDQAPGIVPAE